MGKNIHTIDSHVTYRKGELTTGTPSTGKVACGPGTAYPVPATLDQIAEIFYRVRNTIISGGEYTAEYETEAFRTIYTGMFNASSPPTHNFRQEQYGGDGWAQRIRRGHTFSSTSTNEGWIKHHCGPVYTDEHSLVFGDYHDAEDEFCMWPDTGVVDLVDISQPFQYLQPGAYSPHAQVGANHYAENNGSYNASPPSAYGPYRKREERTYFEEEDGSISYYDETLYDGDTSDFVFNPQVAFIGADSPFDPAATLYPGISWRNLTNTYSFTSMFGSEASNGSAEVVLSSSTLLIPIRLYISAYTTALTSSPRLTVTEWWPYANPDGSPVWNAATGLSM